MADPRYFRFDYDRGLVTEYVREGECNGCGACCLVVIKWLASNNRDLGDKANAWNAGNGDRWMDAEEGIYTAVYWGEQWRFFRSLQITDEAHRCGSLTADNRCSVHLGKRLISRAWPMLPEHVTPFPECSFQFREIAQWTMEAFYA